jgi:hypothetical protein
LTLSAVFIAAALFAVIGLLPLRDSAIGADVGAAFRAVGSQIGRTGPAALLVGLVVAADLLVGAIVLRVVRGRPYESRIDAALFGTAGAILLNTLTLALLGSVGLFTGPVLVAIYVIVVALCWRRCRPLVSPGSRREGAAFPTGVWVFLILAWSAPIILQLASPVVPFRDVLHNHIAPVEFVRTYHWFPRLFTSPAPETGPSRQFLGYIAMLATVCKVTGLPSVLAAAAFALPLTVLTAVATFRLAEHLIGSRAAMWALAVMPLSFVFLRLPDGRATDLAAVLMLASLLPMKDVAARRRVLLRAALVAAVIYVHPLLGSFTLASHALLAVWFGLTKRKEAAEFPIGAMAAAVALALPEFQLAAGMDGPIWILLIALALGAAGAYLWSGVELPLRKLALGAAVPVGAAMLLGAAALLPRAWSAVADVANLYPLTVLGFVVFMVIARRSFARPYLLVPLLVGLLAYVSAKLLPGNTIYWTNTSDEVTGKVAQYWSPAFFVLGTAGTLSWAWEHHAKTITRTLVVLFLIAAVLPLRRGTVDIEENRERRVSETISIDLHKAAEGGWPGWPDQRKLVNDDQSEIIDVFRREQAAGRMTRHTQTIHVAATRWTWVSTPVGAFAGVYETHFSGAPDISGHTLGGRLHGYGALGSYLGPRYAYAFLEPGDVPSGVREEILSAGYRTIFRNDRGEIFRRRA